MLATDPVDVAGLMRSAGDERWSGMPPGTAIGHVHLHVGSLEEVSAFVAEGLGFDRITWSYPGALFPGAGGYHYHLGTNVWAGSGAPPPEAGVAQLLEWPIELPDAAEVAEVGLGLREAGYPAETAAAGELVTHDPWGTAIRVVASRRGYAGG